MEMLYAGQQHPAFMIECALVMADQAGSSRLILGVPAAFRLLRGGAFQNKQGEIGESDLGGGVSSGGNTGISHRPNLEVGIPLWPNVLCSLALKSKLCICYVSQS